MKHTRKILVALLVLMSILMSLAVVAIPASAAAPTKVYLKPNSNWTQSNAWFMARFWQGSSEQWVKMTDGDGDGIYECSVPSGMSNVIFCRMNSSATNGGWNNVWNQTSDLTVQSNGNDCYTIADGAWSKGSGSWDKLAYYLKGDFNSWGDANPMTLSGTSISTTLNLQSGSYAFKINNSFGTWWGSGTTITDTKSNLSFTTSGGNCTIKVTKCGAYTFSFANGKLTVTRADAADAHSYGSVVTAPTCEAEGYTTYTCSKCSDSYVGNKVPAKGHTEGAAVKENLVESTCVETGSYENVVYCSVCKTYEMSRNTTTTNATFEHDFVDGECSYCHARQLISSGSSGTENKEATITFDDTSKRTQYNQDVQVWTENGITVTNNQGSSTSAIGDYAKPVRFYKSTEIIIA